MNTFPKPILVVSKCLGFEACRYNGETIPFPFLQKLEKYVEFRPVCPEVEIGLGIPRKPIRIVEVDGERHLYQPATGKDFVEPMQQFVSTFLDSITEVDGFLLKNRSPSCGPGDVKIYPGFENISGTFRGSGFFGGAVQERFPGIPVEDEGRFRNFTIREHFLTSIFALARFREARKSGRIKDLMEFHSTHKLLLMGLNQAKMRAMGKVVANHQQSDVATVAEQYAELLKLALAKPPREGAVINVLQHALGGFSEVLSKEEKAFFLNSLEEYRDERIPLSAVLHVLKAWAIQHKNDYLLGQAFLHPYPADLVEITDSGKGRKL